VGQFASAGGLSSFDDQLKCEDARAFRDDFQGLSPG
jgi:hypothetical protein